MYFTKELIGNFNSDVEELLLNSSRGYGIGVRSYFSIGENFNVILYCKNGYTREDSMKIGKRIYENVIRNSKTFIKKWEDIFDLNLGQSYPSIGGEGEYSNDYAPGVTLSFSVGKKMKFASAESFRKYLIARKELKNILPSLANGCMLIKDDNNGSTCSIGSYLSYRYRDGKVVPKNHIVLNEAVLESISLAVGKLFEALASFDVSIESVEVYGNPVFSPCKCFFYDTGNGECKLWCDVFSDF